MAYGSSYINEYRKGAVGSASPLQLVIMLYDGALRFMETAKHCMAKKDLYGQNAAVQRAQRIIAELISSLDMKRGGEVPENLLGLYTFAYNRLLEANVQDSPEMIDDCIRVLSELRESWSTLEAQQRGTPGIASEAGVLGAA